MKDPGPGSHPGVGRSRVRLGPVGRPARAGVDVGVVAAGVERVQLGAVVGRGGVGEHLLQVGVVVVVGGLQVHSVRVVVPPARLLRVEQRLRRRRPGSEFTTTLNAGVLQITVMTRQRPGDVPAVEPVTDRTGTSITSSTLTAAEFLSLRVRPHFQEHRHWDYRNDSNMTTAFRNPWTFSPVLAPHVREVL